MQEILKIDIARITKFKYTEYYSQNTPVKKGSDKLTEDYKLYITSEGVDKKIPILEKGMVVRDTNHNKIAIVLGVIDYVWGEARIDTDGMQPIKNLIPLTKEKFDFYMKMDEENNKNQEVNKIYAKLI